MKVEILEYGALVRTLLVPDDKGEVEDVVLGFDSLSGYESNPAPRFAAVVGRYANRISNGAFEIAGHRYQLSQNAGADHLHGGARGFDKRVWKMESLHSGDGHSSLHLSLLSEDGDQGYPGEVAASVRYTLLENDALNIEYEASVSAPTHLNFTQHSYFNLSGARSETVLDHELWVDSDAITELSRSLIPTGSILPVAGTPFDFRSAKPVREAVTANHPQLVLADGLDHNFVLSSGSCSAPRSVARLRDSLTGRTLEVLTTEPGLQVYPGNCFDGSISGKSGRRYMQHAGIALETQHFPDSPNQPAFPSTLVQPGTPYTSTTIFQFGNQR